MVQEIDPQGCHRWRCLACGHETTRRHNLVRHIETRHTQNPGVVCDICSIVCPNKSALSMHVFRKHKNAVQLWISLAMLIQLKWLNKSFSCRWGLCFPRNQWQRLVSVALCRLRVWEWSEKQSFKAHRLQTPERGIQLSHMFQILSKQKRPSETRQEISLIKPDKSF